jgi:ATP-dependent helicase HrpB
MRERLAFLHHVDPTWPDVSDAALVASIDDWLVPALGEARSIADVGRIDLAAALLTILDWKRRAQIDELAPSHVEVPSGSRIAVDYSNPASPALAVRLQEVFGMAATPSVFGGRVLLTMQLLSPAHRPVQVTKDLAAFWRGSYVEVRKEMRGRYPKHDWPEDPASAAPHRGRRRT